jgi:putative redox protein
MRVTLERRNDAVHFVARTEAGGVLPIDGAPAAGGQGLGARPMEVLLASLGGCSGVDVVGILKKQREPVTGMTITVEGEREQGKEPSLFTRIHVHFAIQGPVDDAKVARAIELSMAKYCSVARMLEKSATITWSHALEGAPA